MLVLNKKLKADLIKQYTQTIKIYKARIRILERIMRDLYKARSRNKSTNSEIYLRSQTGKHRKEAKQLKALLRSSERQVKYLKSLK